MIVAHVLETDERSVLRSLVKMGDFLNTLLVSFDSVVTAVGNNFLIVILRIEN